MYGAILGISNVHVQRPRTTKFHLNRINPTELRRHIDFSKWRPRDVANLLPVLFLVTAHLGWSKSTCNPNIGEISQSKADILLHPFSENKQPTCSSSTSGFDFNFCITACHSASAHQNSSKSDHPRQSYDVISIFHFSAQ